MITLNVPQNQFLRSKARFRAFVSGFGGGKTFVGCCGLLGHFFKNPGVHAAYYAPSYKLVRDVFYPTMEEVADAYGFTAKVRVSDHEVHLNYGRHHYGIIRCRTMDNPGSIVGYKSGHALVDEIDIMPTDKAANAWRKILARMRYKVPGLRNGIDVTTTPEGFKFTHDRFVKRGGDHYQLIQASTYQNEKNLPDDYISSLREDYPPQLIDAYIRGEFVNLTSGTVYKNYNREALRSNETVKEREPLFVGMDFNVTQMAATIYVKRNGGREWHAVDEIKDGFDTPDMIRILTERYPDNKITVYPDSSGKNRKSSGASVSDIALLKGHFDIRVRSTNPLVKDRVISANSAFNRGIIRVNDKRCPTTAECLEQQVYDKNGEPDKKGGKDHQNDATTYPIAYEFPVQKPVIKRADMRIAIA